MSNVNFTYVPEHIAQSDLLSLASKKILEALLDYLDNSQASTTRRIYINNKTLCRLAQVGHSVMFKSIKELKQYSLVDRIQGKDRGTASEYIIHFDKLEEPLRKKTFNEFFAKDIEMAKSQETRIGTTITTTIPTTITTSITTSTTITNSTSIETIKTNSNTSSIESSKTISKPISIESQKTISSPTIIEKSIENTNITSIEPSTIKEIEMTNNNDKVEQIVEIDEEEKLLNSLLQFFVKTVNLNVEELYNSFTTHFNYDIESNKELGKKLIDYLFDKLSQKDYELYRKSCENIETIFNLKKPKYLINNNKPSTTSRKVNEYKVDEEDLVVVNEEFIITETVQDEMPF